MFCSIQNSEHLIFWHIFTFYSNFQSNLSFQKGYFGEEGDKLWLLFMAVDIRVRSGECQRTATVLPRPRACSRPWRCGAAAGNLERDVSFPLALADTSFATVAPRSSTSSQSKFVVLAPFQPTREAPAAPPWTPLSIAPPSASAISPEPSTRSVLPQTRPKLRREHITVVSITPSFSAAASCLVEVAVSSWYSHAPSLASSWLRVLGVGRRGGSGRWSRGRVA